MKSVTILGAGVMGSAMTLPFADREFDIRLVGTHLDHEIIADVKDTGKHPKLNIALPPSVRPFTYDQLGEALNNDTDLILLGVSSAGVTWAIDQLGTVLTRSIPVLMITKGMAARPNTLSNFPDLVASSIKEKLGFEVPVAAIAGPCIAGELAVRRNTGTVIVSHDFSLALKLCEALQTDYYHPRASLDMMGVETCAAFKNFFAIAVGWAHGALEKLTPTENKALNNNAAAILFDQAVREMMVLVKTLGGSPESVWGMPGVGDLYVTCQAGRNSRLGQHLGRGLSYTEVKQGPMKQDTIEGAELGIAVSDSIHAMIKTGKIDPRRLPLTLALLQTLTQNTPFNPPWDLLH
jgi:glycerol-3-phosphate dehydrogenase (NAD(P)+)